MVRLVLVFVLAPCAGLCQAHTHAQELGEVLGADAAEEVEGSNGVIAVEDGPSDAAIEERLEGIFENVEALSDVAVAVRSGVVRLEGTAATRRAEERAVALAESMEGVVYVEDRIEQARAVDERVSPAIERVATFWWGFVGRLPLIGIALGVVLLTWLIARVVREWDAPFRIFQKKRLRREVLRQVAATVVMIGGVLLALELLEATALVGAVLGAAGLVGLAVGFAFRDIAENYLASILLGSRRPFALGDHVIIADEHEGKVVRLTTRETVLMTLEGNHLRLPNSLVYKSVILNYTRNPLRELWFDVGVGVRCDLVWAQRVGIDALRETKGVAHEPPPFSRVEALGDWSVAVRFFAWVDQREADWYKVKSEAVRRLKSAFDAHGVEMPFPTHRIDATPLEQTNGEGRRPERDVEEAEHELSVDAHEVEPDDTLERQMRSELELPGDQENLLRDGG